MKKSFILAVFFCFCLGLSAADDAKNRNELQPSEVALNAITAFLAMDYPAYRVCISDKEDDRSGNKIKKSTAGERETRLDDAKNARITELYEAADGNSDSEKTRLVCLKLDGAKNKEVNAWLLLTLTRTDEGWFVDSLAQKQEKPEAFADAKNLLEKPAGKELEFQSKTEYGKVAERFFKACKTIDLEAVKPLVIPELFEKMKKDFEKQKPEDIEKFRTQNKSLRHTVVSEEEKDGKATVTIKIQANGFEKQGGIKLTKGEDGVWRVSEEP